MGGRFWRQISSLGVCVGAPNTPAWWIYVADLKPLIRNARREDLPRIVELLAADQIGRHREELTDPLAPEYYMAFDAIEADPRTLLLVLEMDGGVDGTLQLNFLPGLSRRGAERAQIEGVRI